MSGGTCLECGASLDGCPACQKRGICQDCTGETCHEVKP